MMHVAHLTAHTFVGIGSHTAVNPPSVVPVITPHISMDTLLGLTIKAKYSKTVIGPFGFQFIGQGNDSGFVVPHIGIPPNNALIPLIIAFGGSKPMFSASTVKIDVDGAGTPVACDLIPFNFVGINQACNDPCNYPSDIVICPNSVFVGMTLGDLISGLVLTLVDVAVSWAASKAGGWMGEQMSKAVVSVVMRQAAREITEELGEASTREVLKDVVENVAERPIVQAAATLVEKLFGVGVDQVQEYGESGPDIDRGIHDGVDGPPASGGNSASPPASSTASAGDTLSGADGTDPRIHNAD
ncbi:MAG: hypothetical protein RBT11_13775 [Desulfobacterales bacterium]|jgi:hypothetical protein|nr:hypothetical protein [Desulfobacterales bacterium]